MSCVKNEMLSSELDVAIFCQDETMRGWDDMIRRCDDAVIGDQAGIDASRDAPNGAFFHDDAGFDLAIFYRDIITNRGIGTDIAIFDDDIIA